MIQQKELVFLSFSFSIGILLFIVFQNNYLEFIMFLTGIIYYFLMAKKMISSYFFGAINMIIYSYYAYENHFFEEFGFTARLIITPFFLVAGYLIWRKHSQKNIVISKTLSKRKWYLLHLYTALMLIFGILYVNDVQNESVNINDVVINIISIIGACLSIFRYREQWFYHIVLDILSIFFWINMYIETNSQLLYLTIFMWIVFLVNDLFGWNHWKIDSSAQKTS